MTTTAIESKIKREGGTDIPFGSTVYKFVPYTDGAHVCNVSNPEHADRLLSITEGYGLYRGNGVPVGPLTAPAPALSARAAEPAAAPVAAAAPLPVASADTIESIRAEHGPAKTVIKLVDTGYPDTFIIQGAQHTLAEIVGAAVAKSGFDAATWNTLAKATRDELIEAELNALEDAGPTETTEATEQAAEQAAAAPALSDDRDALVAQYTELFGKKPHYNLGVTKLQDMIAAQLEAKHA